MKQYIEKYNFILVPVILVIVAFFVLYPQLNRFPFIDYDEATYASVVADTLKSGDIWTLKWQEQPWFEKPPLYFWSAMVSVSILDENEVALRLPSMIFGIISLLLTYLITLYFSKSRIAAASAFFLLLFFQEYNYYMREMRLDSGVIMAILAALYALLLGWRNSKALYFVFPAIAIGILLKSVIALLAIPIILIFAYFCKQWNFLRDKKFWIGGLIGLIILLPWHVVQHMRFGEVFWSSYIGNHIFDRALQGIGGEGGSHLRYVYYLWEVDKAFIFTIIVAFIFYVYFFFRKRNTQTFRVVTACLVSALVLFTLFSFAQTQIITYLLPIYPFIAIMLALLIFRACSYDLMKALLIVTPLVAILMVTSNITQYVIFPYHAEEKEIARLYYELSKGEEPLYVVDWPIHESIRYYSKTKPHFFSILKDKDVEVPGSAYVILTKWQVKYLFDEKGELLEQYKNLQIHHIGETLVLLYSDNPIKIPAGSGAEY